MEDCQSGDSLVFFYSGHGLRQPDFDNDEIDGFDETICPVDFEKEGMIVDNYINDTIVQPLKAGVTLHAIVDSCHSGSVLDLVHVYNRHRQVLCISIPKHFFFCPTLDCIIVIALSSPISMNFY